MANVHSYPKLRGIYPYSSTSLREGPFLDKNNRFVKLVDKPWYPVPHFEVSLCVCFFGPTRHSEEHCVVESCLFFPCFRKTSVVPSVSIGGISDTATFVSMYLNNFYKIKLRKLTHSVYLTLDRDANHRF